MKRILFLDHHTELGGGEIALLEIIDKLDKNRFYPYVVLGNNGPLAEKLQNNGVEVIIKELPAYFRQLDRDPKKRNKLFALIKSFLFMPSFAKVIESVIQEKNIDTVYINSIKSALYSVPAAQRAKCRIIWHMHDCLCRDFYNPWTIPIIISLAHKADKVLCVSGIAKEYFITSGGDAEKIEVVYNGIDTEKFKPEIPTQDIKTKYNLVGKKVVSVVGRLEPWKGHQTFIEAAKIISKTLDNVVFLIAGSGFFGFDKYEALLKEKVAKSGLGDKVLFLGFVEGIETIYAASDIVVHCSNRPEPFGRDIIEAMACEKAVIATKIGSPIEIIDDGIDGILINPNDAPSLAQETLHLIEDVRTAEKLGKRAREKVQKKFKIAQIVNKIEQLL